MIQQDLQDEAQLPPLQSTELISPKITMQGVFSACFLQRSGLQMRHKMEHWVAYTTGLMGIRVAIGSRVRDAEVQSRALRRGEWQRCYVPIRANQSLRGVILYGQR